MDSEHIECIYNLFKKGQDPFSAIRIEANSLRDSEPLTAAHLFETGAVAAEKVLEVYKSLLVENQMSNLRQIRTAFYQAAADIYRDSGDVERAIGIYRKIGSESEARSLEKNPIYRNRF